MISSFELKMCAQTECPKYNLCNVLQNYYKSNMSKLKQCISQAMDNLPAIFMYTGSDGAEYSEDPNLKDIYHFAETIRNVCKLNIGYAASD
jgi:hypothetical protein